MKEQAQRAIDLTAQPNPSKLKGRGDIFMAEGGEGPKSDLRGAKFREGLRNSRLGEVLHVRRSPQGRTEAGNRADDEGTNAPEAPATPPGGNDGGSRDRSAPPSGTPGPDNDASNNTGETSLSRESLREAITRPDFRAILQPDMEAEELYKALNNRYQAVLQDLTRRIGEVSSETTGDPERSTLNNELKTLTTEYNLIKQFLMITAPAHERGIDEGTSRELDEIESLSNNDLEKNKRIRKFMKEYVKHNSPEDEPLPDRVLKLIAQDEAATDEFITRLIVSELENEPWQIKGFYGNINFEKFMRITRGIITGDRRERLISLIDANSAFHNMNYIMKRNFEQFSQQSEAILPQQLVVLSNVPGVADAISLYEELYATVRSRNTRITEKSALEIDKDVQRELSAQALLVDREEKPIMPGIAGGKMEEWEVFRAYIYARNYFRIVDRAAEHITLSELADKGDPALYVSSPQVKLTQILNVLKFVGFRFRPETPMGGPELLDRTLANNTKERKKRGVRMKTLQGTDVDMREFQSIIAARGVFATWRNSIALGGMRFVEDDGRVTNAVQFFLDHRQEIEGLKKRSSGSKKLSDAEKQKLKDDTAILFAPLLKNASTSLGLLVSPSGLNVTTEFKELVWEKIANLDPLVTASLLTRLEMDIGEGENPPEIQIQALEDILLSVWGTADEKKVMWGTGKGTDRAIEGMDTKDLSIRELRRRIGEYLDIPDSAKPEGLPKEVDDMRMELGRKEEVLKKILESDKWQVLTHKLRTAHRLRMGEEEERIKERQKNETEEDFKARISTGPKALDDFLTGDLELTDDEKKVLDAITGNGKEMVGDLARIKQSHAWFLDDVPIKTLDWMNLGQVFDRKTADEANFSKAAGAQLKIISNPFGRSPEDILKDFTESINAASMVLGRESAQDNQQPLLEAYLEMIYEKPKFRQIIIEAVAHAAHHPTSRAQEIAGMDAPAVAEDGMLTILEHALRDGIVRKEVKDAKGNVQWDGTFEKLQVKFDATRLDVFWRKIKDFGPLGIIAFLIQFFNSIGKNK